MSAQSIFSLQAVRQVPLSTSHIRSVWSQEAEMARRPSSVTVTTLTQSACPSSARTNWPRSKSQRRSVPSTEAEMARRPSGVIATAVTQPAWPSRTRTVSPICKSHTRGQRSQRATGLAPLRRRRKSGKHVNGHSFACRESFRPANQPPQEKVAIDHWPQSHCRDKNTAKGNTSHGNNLSLH